MKRWLTTRRTLAEVAHERTRQDRIWGTQDHDPAVWLAILTEEVGELATAILHESFDNQGELHGSGNLREEAVQVAAVAVAFIEYLDRK